MRTRRHVLLGVAGLPLVTGCLGGGADDGSDDTDRTTDDGRTPTTVTTEPTPTRTTTPSESATSPASTTPSSPSTSTATPTATPTPTPTPEPAATATVRISGGSFDPHRLAVAPNTRVRWVNDDPDAHRIESTQVGEATTPWEFTSREFGRGGSVARVFRDPGTYAYFSPTWGRSTSCGLVSVGDATFDGDLPCESGY
ncbi:cupredoxin domain-containing protein [Salinigranum salinum]|uniref:cupredoxin domain-containing protein n=1 Tax=Salinigranum salinum TaxID=1364937 RepID=UPI00186562CB|nr:plastocyanin [Salinigranum salinum]